MAFFALSRALHSTPSLQNNGAKTSQGLPPDTNGPKPSNGKWQHVVRMQAKSICRVILERLCSSTGSASQPDGLGNAAEKAEQ
jgi:hypothetical protein